MKLNEKQNILVVGIIILGLFLMGNYFTFSIFGGSHKSNCILRSDGWIVCDINVPCSGRTGNYVGTMITRNELLDFYDMRKMDGYPYYMKIKVVKDNYVNSLPRSGNYYVEESWYNVVNAGSDYEKIVYNSYFPTLDNYCKENGDYATFSYKIMIFTEQPKCQCPENSSWSECVNNQQSRTIYECGPDTNYVCISKEETAYCESQPVETNETLEINTTNQNITLTVGTETEETPITFWIAIVIIITIMGLIVYKVIL